MDEKALETAIDPSLSFSVEKGKTRQIPQPVYDENEKWVKEYIEQYGVEPSFF